MVNTICESFNTAQTSTANTTQYWRISGRLFVDTETNAATIFRSTGDITSLLVKVSANSVAATSTFTLRKNGSTDLNNTVSVGSSATGDFEDTTPHTDTLSAADKVYLKTVPGAGTGTYTIRMISVLFAATTNTISKLATGFVNNLSTASTTSCMSLSSDAAFTASASEANCKCRQRKAGTFKNGAVLISANRATTSTARLRKNGANGNTAVSITGGGATGWYEDTVNTDTVSAGEDWNWALTTGTGADTLTVVSMHVEFESTNGDGELISSNPTTLQAITDNTNRFFPVSGRLEAQTAESGASGIDTKARAAFDAVEMTCLITQNDVGSASTLMFRKGAANTILTASITANTTGVFTDAHTVSLLTTDLVNTQVVVPSVSGTHTVTVANIIVWTHLSTSNSYTTSLPTETVSVSDSIARLLAATRNPVETTNISESPALARLLSAFRTLPETTSISEGLVKSKGQPSRLSTETVTVGETLARQLAAIRTLQDTTAISESLTRMLAALRTLSDTTAVSESLVKSKGQTRNPTENVTISEGLTRMLSANRPINENTSIGESLARMLGAKRTITENTSISESLITLKILVRALATETVTVSDSLTRMLAANRTLSDTVTIGETLTRQLAAIRALTTETVTVSDSITRMLAATRTLSDNTTVGESLTRKLAASRALATEITNVSDQLTRMLAATRALQDTIIISEQLDYTFTPGGGGPTNYNRTLTETTNISESLERMLAATRALASENTAISESLQRSAGRNRTLSENVSIGESLLRKLSALRTNIENTSVVDNLSRMLSATRTNTENTSVSDSLSKQLGAIRSIIENTISSDNISRKLSALRTLIDTTSISDILDYVYGAVGARHYFVELIENVAVSDSVRTTVEYIKQFITWVPHPKDTETVPLKRKTPGWFRNTFYTLTRKRRKGTSNKSSG